MFCQGLAFAIDGRASGDVVTPLAKAMVGEIPLALIKPDVAASTLRAKSGGQSVESRSCESLPFEMKTAPLSSVRLSEFSSFRYWSSVMKSGLE